MRSHWGWRKSATIHDLVRIATSLTNLQHGSRDSKTPRPHDRTDRGRGNQGCISGNVNIIILTPSLVNRSSQKSYRKHKSSPQSLGYAMPILHQQLQQSALQSFPPPWAWKLIDNGPILRFWLATNLSTTAFSATPFELCTTLINRREARLPNKARRLLLYPSNA